MWREPTACRAMNATMTTVTTRCGKDARMHVLITGGAGFVGSHLAQTMLDGGHRVSILDDLSTGRRDNLDGFIDDDRCRFVEGSILDENLVDQLAADCDAIFHLASAVGVQLIIDQPVKTIETIVDGTDRVLRCAHNRNLPTLITSSSEVYGKGSKVPFAESDDVVLGPSTTRRWVYACAKMLDEFLALAHWYESKLPVVCVRLFNTVGPRQTGQYGMVLPRFVQWALEGKPITVYGDGEQTRCFCHVSDVVGALSKLITCDQAFGRVINIGSNQEVTINQLAQRVKTITDSSSPIERIAYEQAYVEGFEDMRRRVPDLTQANELIGYKPTHDLDAIIHSIVAYWRDA
jgi:UDP-glucose 4-epimerase